MTGQTTSLAQNLFVVRIDPRAGSGATVAAGELSVGKRGPGFANLLIEKESANRNAAGPAFREFSTVRGRRLNTSDAESTLHLVIAAFFFSSHLRALRIDRAKA